MKLKTLTGLLLCCYFAVVNAAEDLTINIRVGIHAQPPFQLENPKGGAAYELVRALNTVQSTFNFELVPIPVKRKIQSMQEGWIDVSIFDNPKWGWQQKVNTSFSLIKTQDVFITKNKPGIVQNYLKEYDDKKIVLVRGYHYNFIDFETEVTEISRKIDVTLVNSEVELIKMVLMDRADIGVVNNVTLDWFLKQNTRYRDDIYRSNFFDSEVQRYLLTFEGSPIDTEEVNAIISLADKKGLLAPIYKKYAMEKPTFN